MNYSCLSFVILKYTVTSIKDDIIPNTIAIVDEVAGFVISGDFIMSSVTFK